MDNKIKNQEPYLPRTRSWYNPGGAYSKKEAVKDDIVNMPDLETDPIVVNNIAWQEFDYTDDLTKEKL